MTELCKLAEKHGTDKIYYSAFYHNLLQCRRWTCQAILEIGIGTPEAMEHVKGYRPGASLRMWRDYFPRADVYGIDIDPKACAEALEGRIHTSVCDQRNEFQLRSSLNGRRFDLIVDDGCHDPQVQLETAKVLVPYLERHGLYIIEDVGNLPELSAQIEWEHTVIQHVGALVGRAIVIYEHS